MRRVIAKNMTRSSQEAPHFYLAAEVDMTDECIRYNTAMQEYRVQPSSVLRVTRLIKG